MKLATNAQVTKGEVGLVNLTVVDCACRVLKHKINLVLVVFLIFTQYEDLILRFE